MHIERNQDVISGAPDLELLHSFLHFPVFMGVSDAPPTSDLLVDMSFWISRSSGMIQLNPLLPLDVLYPSAHGAGCVGAAWASHHQGLADFVARFAPQSVLEIGGGHGILATNYLAKSKIPWTILEPNPTPVARCEAQFIAGFFDDNFQFPVPVDAVVHSHVFEHIYDPDAFVRQLAAFLPEGKHLLFSVPNMQEWLKRRYTNCLNFEHTTYLSESYIEFLLARHGFRVVEREYFRDDHSIFYAAVRDSQVQPVPLPADLYSTNLSLYNDYLRYHHDLIETLNRQMDALEGPIYLFGAHVFSQYLLAFGLRTDRVVALLDNDPHKQGKRLYGTELQVLSPKVLAQDPKPSVILKAGVYTQEIRYDILCNINADTRFLE